MPSARARSACGSPTCSGSTPRPAPTSTTRCCSRTRAARRTRPGWRRCSPPTTTSRSAAPSASTGRAGCRRSRGRGGPSLPAARRRARVRGLRAIKAEGKVTQALMRARCDRGAEIALPDRARGADGRGDPRARRALGRRRPAARAARRRDPAARPDRVPGADGRDLPRPRRRRQRAGGGRAAQRPLVRPGARRGAPLAPRRPRLLGVGRRRRRVASGSPPAGGSSPTTSGWTRSRRRSPASSTRSRPGPTATPTAPA